MIDEVVVEDNDLLIVNEKKEEVNADGTHPIRVLFDSQIFDRQKFGGISRMYADMAEELNVKDEDGQDFSATIGVYTTSNEYLKGKKQYAYIEEKTDNRKRSERLLSEGNFDIFYPTFFDQYFIGKLNGKPMVMSVHDMIPEIYKEFFSRNDLQIIGKEEMVKYASAIEVPTDTTKRDLIRILHVDPKKIHVIGRCLSENFGDKWIDKKPLDFKYILYVGQRNAYKRFDWFIKHISEFLNTHDDINVVCTGQKFTPSEVAIMKKYGVEKRFFTTFVNDIQLASLYKYAEMFIFTSEYEGFGIPVLESYKMDCIALLNDNDCFREITFDKGTFFNMTKEESNLKEQVEYILSLTEEERKEIIETQRWILSQHGRDQYFNNIRQMLWEVHNNHTEPIERKDLDIYICTHKDFEQIVHNPSYKVVDAREINDDIAENGLKGSFYSELMMYKHIAETAELKKYIGFCHYRKYFSFLDNIPDIDELFKQFDCIVAKVDKFDRTVLEQYRKCHNIEDMLLAKQIVDEYYPEYPEAMEILLSGKMLVPCHMFIMKSEDFKEFVEFVYGVLDKYVDAVGTDIEKRVNDNKEKYIKEFSPNNLLEYQYRIGGYIGERLTNVFLFKKFKKMKMYDVVYSDKQSAYTKLAAQRAKEVQEAKSNEENKNDKE